MDVQKHIHVVRSNYAAELHMLVNEVNQALTGNYCLTEVMNGVQSATTPIEIYQLKLLWYTI